MEVGTHRIQSWEPGSGLKEIMLKKVSKFKVSNLQIEFLRSGLITDFMTSVGDPNLTIDFFFSFAGKSAKENSISR